MPLKYLRANIAHGVTAGAVDREARLIKGVAATSHGEQLGHDLWSDGEMLAQCVAAGNAAANGIKSRFAHPGLCADGIGSHLGRMNNFRLDGNVVRCDLTFADVASKSPNGDLAGYVMDLADEDPQAFGASIVYGRDVKAENDFMLANGGREVECDEGTCIIGFKSPDPLNTQNYRHARLNALRACDVVDEPAANPSGFLSSGEELASVGESALSYIFGLAEKAPAQVFGSLDANRVKTFVQSFLQRHSLSLTVARTAPGAGKESVMTPEEKASAQEELRTSERTRIAALKAAYPKHPDFVLAQIENGASLADASNAFKDVQLAEAQATITALKAAPVVQPPATPAKLGVDPVKFGGGEGGGGEGKGFMQLAREYASAKGIPLGAAVSACVSLHKAEHEAYVEEQRNAKPRKIDRTVASK